MAIPTYYITIKEMIKEAKDSVSFVFDIPSEYKNIFYYAPAQFLTFEFFIKNEKVLRSYSISSCPLLNEELKTTVKRVKGGLISNYMIDHLKPGDKILSRKPAGRFFKAPKNLKPKRFFLFAGGSGITPLFSIIKTALLSDPQNEVTLFYANRDLSSIIYHKELKEWKTNYLNRFKILHILSQEKTQWSHVYGRLKKTHLENFFFKENLHHKDNLYYLCGPVEFMETIESFLINKNVKKDLIRKENFLSSSQKKTKKDKTSVDNTTSDLKDPKRTSKKENTPPPPVEPLPSSDLTEAEVRLKRTNEDPKADKIIRAFIDEEKYEIKATEDIPILEQLLAAGHSPPFSCLSGSCLSCMAVLKKGQISQQERGVLEDENLENYEILTCQAKPESSIVEVDYNT